MRTILAVERDGKVLAKMKNVRIRASAADIEKSLRGNWRAEHPFALTQAVALFDANGEQLAACDQQLEAMLAVLQQDNPGEPGEPERRSRARNAPKFDLHTQLFRTGGVDLVRIDGIDVTTALAVTSETGANMSRFATTKHFTGCLGLCPGAQINGGKIRSGMTIANGAGKHRLPAVRSMILLERTAIRKCLKHSGARDKA